LKDFAQGVFVSTAVFLMLVAFQNCGSSSLPSLSQNSTTPLPAGLKIKYLVGTAVQNADLSTVAGSWQDIPALAVSFTLTSEMTVDVRATGSATVISGTTYLNGHCGFRIVIDGTPLSSSVFGDRVAGVNEDTANNGWWTPWSLERHQDLAAGSHVITLQQTGWVGTDSGCMSSASDQSAAHLTVEAY